MRSRNSTKAKQIGSRIALARKEAGGMKQRELADLLDVTERSIAAYEAGDVIPYRFLPKLEQALGRPAAWFLYGDGAMEPKEAIHEAVERQKVAMKMYEQQLENHRLMLAKLDENHRLMLAKLDEIIEILRK